MRLGELVCVAYKVMEPAKYRAEFSPRPASA